MEFRRYAIYHSFAPAPWSDWATRWLGWDMASGTRPHPLERLGFDPAPLTETPSRYGLHATLKPPFGLSGPRVALARALERFCAAHTPVPVGRPRILAFGRFLALVPEAQSDALTTMAARIVHDFDGFRAPLSDDEIARRRHGGLSPAQEANLYRWGYPHVMDAFRYHITLTGKLPKPALRRAGDALVTHLAPLLPDALTLDALSLVGEDDAGRFHLIARTPFTG